MDYRGDIVWVWHKSRPRTEHYRGVRGDTVYLLDRRFQVRSTSEGHSGVVVRGSKNRGVTLTCRRRTSLRSRRCFVGIRRVDLPWGRGTGDGESTYGYCV